MYIYIDWHEQAYALMYMMDLLAPTLNLKAANATVITILGAAFIYISGMGAGGRRWGTHQLVYVAEGLDQLLLSKEACQSLGIIGRDFPAIGSHGQADTMEMAVADEPVPNIALDDPELPTPCSPRSDNSCDCPRREEQPPPPDTTRPHHLIDVQGNPYQ